MAPPARDVAPGKPGDIVIWRNGSAAVIEARWGLPPFRPGGKPIPLLRYEGRTIANPCLLVANDFTVRPAGKRRGYRVSLITDQPFFCLAGVWRAAEGAWPASYAALTVPANPDIAPLKDRHVAIVRPVEWEDWLRQTRPVEELLRPFPKGSFRVVLA